METPITPDRYDESVSLYNKIIAIKRHIAKTIENITIVSNGIREPFSITLNCMNIAILIAEI
jgi:hypothetical protein